MRGHEQLLAMRRHGMRPNLVFIDVGQDCSEQWRDWHRCTPEYAHIEVGASDAIHHLDLRFCVGLKVVVTATQAGVAKALFEACTEAGAATVIAAALENTSNQWQTSFKATEIHDSREAATA